MYFELVIAIMTGLFFETVFLSSQIPPAAEIDCRFLGG